MWLPHGLVNTAKQGGVPVDQVELGKQQTGRLMSNAFLVRTTKTDRLPLHCTGYISMVPHAQKNPQVDTHGALL